MRNLYYHLLEVSLLGAIFHWHKLDHFFFLFWLWVNSFHENKMSFSPVWLNLHCLWWQVWVKCYQISRSVDVCREQLLAQCCVSGWMLARYFKHKMKQRQVLKTVKDSSQSTVLNFQKHCHNFTHNFHFHQFLTW